MEGENSCEVLLAIYKTTRCHIHEDSNIMYTTYLHFKSKSKAIPVTGRGGLYGCEMSRIPYYLDNRLGEIVSLTRRQGSSPQEEFLVLISVRGWVNARA
jgi:hypothetical protein